MRTPLFRIHKPGRIGVVVCTTASTFSERPHDQRLNELSNGISPLNNDIFISQISTTLGIWGYSIGCGAGLGDSDSSSPHSTAGVKVAGSRGSRGSLLANPPQTPGIVFLAHSALALSPFYRSIIIRKVRSKEEVASNEPEERKETEARGDPTIPRHCCAEHGFSRFSELPCKGSRAESQLSQVPERNSAYYPQAADNPWEVHLQSLVRPAWGGGCQHCQSQH